MTRQKRLYTDIPCLGGIFAKNTTPGTGKISRAIAREIYLSRGWYFWQISRLNMVYLYNYTDIQSKERQTGLFPLQTCINLGLQCRCPRIFCWIVRPVRSALYRDQAGYFGKKHWRDSTMVPCLTVIKVIVNQSSTSGGGHGNQARCSALMREVPWFLGKYASCSAPFCQAPWFSGINIWQILPVTKCKSHAR